MKEAIENIHYRTTHHQLLKNDENRNGLFLEGMVLRAIHKAINTRKVIRCIMEDMLSNPGLVYSVFVLMKLYQRQYRDGKNESDRSYRQVIKAGKSDQDLPTMMSEQVKNHQRTFSVT